MMLRTLAPLAFLLSAGVAHADAVGPPDPDVTCPEGASVEVNHCGTVCVRRQCETDADCRRPGDECREVQLCVEDQPYCGGWTSDPYERIRGECASGCGSYECRTLRACVAPTSDEDAGAPSGDAGTGEVVTYGCGCRVGAARSPALLAWGVAGLLWLGLRRRR